jgi:hypothetical protein
MREETEGKATSWSSEVSWEDAENCYQYAPPEQTNKKSTHVKRTTTRDDYETPSALWNILNEIYRFDVDCAASPENAKCKDFYHMGRSFLTAPESELESKRCWLNCPFSQKDLFLSQVTHHRQITDIFVVIVPNNARETDWWNQYIKGFADEIVNLTPRVFYELDGVPQKNVPFSSCLAIYYPRLLGADYGLPKETYWNWK